MKRLVAFFLSISFVVLAGRASYPVIAHYSYSESDFFRNQEALAALIESENVKTVIEVGSFYGESTTFIAKHLPYNGQVFAVDSWIGYPKEIYNTTYHVYERFISNVIHAEVTDKITPIRMTSLSAARTFSKYAEKADMIYIDGDHSFEAVYSDIQAWSPYLKEGGVLCGNLFSKHNETNAIKKAVKNYCRDNNKTPRFNGCFWQIK